MMIVRRAIAGDEELLARLNGSVQDVHLERRPDHFRQTQLQELAVWYRSVLENPGARVWIAEDGAAAIGYILCIVRHLSETPFIRAKDWLEIEQIAVESNHRRRGAGRALMAKAVTHARAEGIDQIEAAVWCFNDGAREVFRRLGFTTKTTRFELSKDSSRRA